MGGAVYVWRSTLRFPAVGESRSLLCHVKCRSRSNISRYYLIKMGNCGFAVT